MDHVVATHMTEAGWACGPGLGGEDGSTGTQGRELSKGGGVLPPSFNTPDSLALREGGIHPQWAGVRGMRQRDIWEMEGHLGRGMGPGLQAQED